MVARTTTGSACPAISGSERAARRRRRIIAALISCTAPAALVADPLPTGGSVASGDVTISQPSGSRMDITQGSHNAIVNWQSFGIGAGNTVEFHQPSADSAILNRVTGGTTSGIYGTLKANGQVHLVNPNGIFIGRDGKVSAGGGFVGSTLNISDEDFEARRFRYSGDGSSATVENRGSITIGRGGYAALMGGKVKNAGSVTVPLGRIGLASGERVTLDLSGDGFLQVALPTGTELSEGEALVENSGSASAAGGRVEMKAATARNAARHAINLSGVAEASSVSVRGGTIVLGGGAGGTVTVSGRARAQSRQVAALESSPRPQARPGGEIEITGARIALEGADLSTSGTGGGGLIRVGGDFAGQGALPHAESVVADAATTISADATEAGDGGRIVLWSDAETTMAGQLSARGGDEDGDGGYIEVSSAGRLAYSGRADTRAEHGDWGMLLLDPIDIVIDPGAGGEDDLEANLVTSNVTLDTFASSASDPGDITINADIDWSTGTTLQLFAARDILLNGAINGANGSFVLDAVEDISTTSDGLVNVGAFDLRSGNWAQLGALIPGFSADDFIVRSGATFLRAVGGDGSAADPYLIADLYGLQGVGTTSLASSWALNNDIDASATQSWTGDFDGAGFAPLFLDGSFDGNLHTISGLYINRPDNGETAPTVGLFDSILAGSSVSRLFLTGADVTGASGGLLAANNEGTVTAVSAEGTLNVTQGASGGLVGQNGGLLTDSMADVQITATLDGIMNDTLETVGGLAGDGGGTIRRSHAGGNITVTLDGASDILAYVGGLVGEGYGTEIEDSYSTTDITISGATASNVTLRAGGFGGSLIAPVTTSYSTGSVTNTSDADAAVGGFAGEDSESTGDNTNFWDTERSGLATSASGIGLTTAELQDTAGFISLAAGLGWDFANVWAPGESGRDPVNYSTSRVVFAEPDVLSLTYGDTVGATATGSVSGGPGVYVFGPDDDTLDTAPIFASPAFADETVGTTTYAVDSGDLTSAQGETYDVVALAGDAEITPAPLTITADDQSKTYGEGLSLGVADVSVEGLVFSDSVDDATVTSAGTAVDADVSGSPYSIEVSDATGTGLENYDITYVFGALTVDPAALTITARDIAKTYGDALTLGLGDVLVEGLLFDDSVDGVEITSAGADEGATVAGSPYAISAGGASGSGLGNYDITYVDGDLTVTPRDLTITAADRSKTYGDVLSLGLSDVEIEGLVNEDSVDGVTVTSAGSGAEAGVAGSPYAITASDAEGSGLANYDISYVEGALTVDARSLLITALDRSKTYGDALSLGVADVDVEGLVNGDSVDDVTVASAGAGEGATVGDSPYAITASDASGEGVENYDITYVDGELTVFRRDLTLTASDRSKVYGDALSLGLSDVEIEGLVNGDSLDDVAITSDGAAPEADVLSEGTYAIDLGAAEGEGLENYAISYLSGSLTVTPAPLTVRANDQVKEAGESFVFDGTEFTVSGLKVDGDSVTSAALTSEGADSEATAAGSPYAIEVAGAEGEGLSNYEITYVEGEMVVQNPEAQTPPPPPPPPASLPNPPDRVNVSFSGGDSSPGTPVASGGAPAPSVEQAEQTLGLVRTIAGSLEQSASACSGGGGDVSRVLECLSNALGDFATDLDDLSTELPPGMENVARIVQDARAGVDAARARAEQRLASATTDAERRAIRDDALREAQTAVGTAATEIRKAITLVRAEDPELAQLQRETITTVAAAMDGVNIELSRAVGL